MHLKTSANLGIAIRQKSQVMILMMFVILKFMDEQKNWGDLRKEQREKIKANRAGVAKRRVAGRKLPVAGFQLPVTSHQFPAPSTQRPPVHKNIGSDPVRLASAGRAVPST
jgi:hypothetical protein